jgi:hypothetical protein
VQLGDQAICVERGITGARESVLLDSLLSEGIDLSLAMSRVKAEVDDPSLDADWPDHPLSKLRRSLEELVDSVVMAPEIDEEKRLAPGW